MADMGSVIWTKWFNGRGEDRVLRHDDVGVIEGMPLVPSVTRQSRPITIIILGLILSPFISVPNFNVSGP